MEENTQLRLMLAYLCISKESEASLPRKVEVLDKFELVDSEIATVCGATVQSIRNARQTLKNSRNAKSTTKKR